ncbi:MAG: DUF2922 domain-containing protein [Defluviitaleaceae bacterium]|nr:DUF2922 domain-containing protein [Defluviitaleaceae bacterium]
MTTRNNAILTFNSNIGKVVRLSIPRADMTLTSARAQTAMDEMIAGGIIITSGGTPTSIRGAELVTTTRAGLLD